MAGPRGLCDATVHRPSSPEIGKASVWLRFLDSIGEIRLPVISYHNHTACYHTAGKIRKVRKPQRHETEELLYVALIEIRRAGELSLN